MGEISLIIDGTEVKAREGSTVLEAAWDSGIYIPTLCAATELERYGGCRLCLVEIENVEGLPASCMTPVAEGMVIHTDTSRVSEVRRRVLELILCDHPDDCLPCPRNQDCELQRVASYIGIDHLRFKKLERLPLVDTSNPFFIRDSTKCILCGKCVRVCKEVQGVAALEIDNDGLSSKIVAVGDVPILDSICESCGECIVMCPVGALVPKNMQKPSYEVRTVCSYCGCGCGLYLGVRGSSIVSVRGDAENPANKGNLCVKGRFGYGFINHPERLTTPLIKRDGSFVEATWEEALDLVAGKLADYKGDQFAAIASGKCTNEDNYVIQKFARAVMSTNNIDHCARLPHDPALVGLSGVIGSGAMTNPIDEISDAACILAIGTDTTEDHPIIGLRVKKAKQNGAKLIVANPRQIDLCRFADIWLQQRPGSDVALLMGMARVILDEGLVDVAFIQERCENFDEFRKSLRNFDLDTVERITGVAKAKIVDAARIYAANNPASILWSMGITQYSHGADNVFALANLAMLTGNIGKPSSGLNPLRGQNNIQGACDMGCLPIIYPGYQMVADHAIRRRFEAAWGVNLNPKPGKTIAEDWQGASEGKIKALYLVGVDPVFSAADSQQARDGLEAAEFVVVQDIFLNEAAKFADVVLPAVSFAEKDGTFTNTERRIQRVHKAIGPVGNSRPDWWIVCEIARRLGGSGFDFSHPAEIMEEIASVTPIYKGVSYDRLENGGLQWPCPSGEHPGTPVLHVGQFRTANAKGKFTPLEYKPSAELPDDEYPLVLTCEHQYHTALSRKVEGLNLWRNQDLVEMNPQDATGLGIGDGEMVRVISRRGEVEAKAKVTDESLIGVVCMTSHFPAVDAVSGMPELKVCAVRVEKALPLKNKGASQR